MGHEVGMSLLSLIPRPGLWRRAEWARQRGEGAGLGVQCGYCEAIYIYICMYVCCMQNHILTFLFYCGMAKSEAGWMQKKGACMDAVDACSASCIPSVQHGLTIVVI